MKRFKVLRHLFGAYLHQDWDIEYSDNVWMAIGDFCFNPLADYPTHRDWLEKIYEFFMANGR